jgi:hypothetical protein
MGLFGRLFRRSGARKGEGEARCMECGMTGGEHTDWCPAVSDDEPDLVSDPTLERRPEAEGPTE